MLWPMIQFFYSSYPSKLSLHITSSKSTSFCVFLSPNIDKLLRVCQGVDIYICMSDVTIISYVSKYYSYNLQLRGVNGSNLVKLRLSTVYHYYLMFLIIFLLISEHLHLMFYVLPLILIMTDEMVCDWPKRSRVGYPM